MFSQNKIVLLSNFRNPVCEDKIDVIVQTLKDMDIDLTVMYVFIFSKQLCLSLFECE